MSDEITTDDHVRQLWDRAEARDDILSEALDEIRDLHEEISAFHGQLTDGLDAGTIGEIVSACRRSRLRATLALLLSVVALLAALLL